VLVAGGAEKVRMPREPELKPPPARASALETAATVGTISASATAATLKKAVNRLENLIFSTLSIPVGIWLKSGHWSADLEGRSAPAPAALGRGHRILNLHNSQTRGG
jgi:hypothetical protein